MAEHLLRYQALAKFLVKQRIAVIGHDHLGHGKTAENGTLGYFHDSTIEQGLVKDLYRITQWGRQHYPEIPYFILGHSMGSFVLRNYLYEYGQKIDGAIFVGTGQQPTWLTALGKNVANVLSKIQGEKHPSKLVDVLAFGTMNRKIKNKRTEKDWLVTLPTEVNAYLADKHCGFLFTLSGYQELFSLIISAQDNHLMTTIPTELPLLFLSGKEDPVGEYGKGVMKAASSYRKAGVENVTVRLYENARHELLNEAQKEDVFRDICKWMEKIYRK
ncbi:hypothetical protein RV04_GL002261 [Enterococcus hermanniensis]|uniref:Serine aminopeptidase S33 domain-containing protein n=2 Tax=Enterococcus hermanniensis TaxID=249189 RepID=A0A1L8TLW9_9ENTE|nr:hypothetical protein RV04_GL002261 [Enterococcus hermanniensis]